MIALPLAVIISSIGAFGFMRSELTLGVKMDRSRVGILLNWKYHAGYSEYLLFTNIPARLASAV